jgi:hypothetical protein
MSYNEQTVMNEIKELMNAVDITYFPTKPQLLTVCGLCGRVSKVGGSKYLAKKYNIETKIFGNSLKFSDEEIKNKLLEVVNKLNLDRFPTRDEMNNTTNSHSLSGLVSKRGGFIKWANILNLPIKESETLIGYKGEQILKDLIESKGYKIERQTANCFYDFIINDYIRTECKYSHLYHGKNGNFYSFSLETKMHDCDIYIFICEDDNENKKILIIPQSFLQNQGQVSVGEFNSKWYKYINRYDLIDTYNDFYININKEK